MKKKLKICGYCFHYYETHLERCPLCYSSDSFTRKFDVPEYLQEKSEKPEEGKKINHKKIDPSEPTDDFDF